MSKHRRKAGLCPNCNETLAAEDNFCKKCGQENHDLNVPFHHLAGEFIESIFHIETKLWHTLKAIFTKPGKITSDFIAGKRASYMPPARLYIFVSFVFFLLVTVLADKFFAKNNSSEKLKELVTFTSNFEIAGKTVKIGNKQIEQVTKFTDTQFDSLLIATKITATLQNREKLKIDVANFQTMMKTFTSNGKMILVQDSVSQRVITLDSTEIPKLKNYSDKQLHEFLASKKVFPEKNDFKDLKDDLNESENIKSERKTTKKFTLNGISGKVLDKIPIHLTAENLDSLLIANKLETSFYNRLTIKLYHRYKEFDYQRDFREYSHKVLKNLSWVLYILMPFVAIILLTIYYRSKRNYYEYFIFAIHIHSVLFLAMSLELIVRLLLKSSYIIPIYSLVVMYFYFLFSLKNVYRQSWIKTIFKFLFLNLTYGIIFLIFLLTTLIWSFATLE